MGWRKGCCSLPSGADLSKRRGDTGLISLVYPSRDAQVSVSPRKLKNSLYRAVAQMYDDSMATLRMRCKGSYHSFRRSFFVWLLFTCSASLMASPSMHESYAAT